MCCVDGRSLILGAAIERADDGERTVCIDEMTGIQALSKEKDLPLRPGKVKRHPGSIPSTS